MGSVLNALDDIQMRFDDDVVYVVGSNVEYAVYVEFGTSRQSAQPYLLPAARKVERELAGIASGKGSMEAIVKAAALEVEREAKQRVPVDTGNLKASIKTEKLR